jgi:hypothetical protein
MASKFDAIPIGRYFKAGGSTYLKTSPLTYTDSATGIEEYWEPLFDGKIEAVTGSDKPQAPVKSEKEFTVDPRTRVVTRNPKFLDATKAFAELWGSALFDCGPEDYEFMVNECVKWGNARKHDEQTEDTV